MTYNAYEIDLRHGRHHRANWMRQARLSRDLAASRPDEAARHLADVRKFAKFSWDSHRRWMRARRVEVSLTSAPVPAPPR